MYNLLVWGSRARGLGILSNSMRPGASISMNSLMKLWQSVLDLLMQPQSMPS